MATNTTPQPETMHAKGWMKPTNKEVLILWRKSITEYKGCVKTKEIVRGIEKTIRTSKSNVSYEEYQRCINEALVAGKYKTHTFDGYYQCYQFLPQGYNSKKLALRVIELLLQSNELPVAPDASEVPPPPEEWIQTK